MIRNHLKKMEKFIKRIFTPKPKVKTLEYSPDEMMMRSLFGKGRQPQGLGWSGSKTPRLFQREKQKKRQRRATKLKRAQMQHVRHKHRKAG